MKRPSKTARQRLLEKRDKILPELSKFEAKHGPALARSAMTKHLLLARQKDQRLIQIEKLTQELDKIKKGKTISPY